MWRRGVRSALQRRNIASNLHMCVQLWISHDDAQIKRLGGRVLAVPAGDIFPAADLDSLPPSKSASSAALQA